MECNYIDVDRHIKEQLIHGLNDSEMLAQPIREVTKSDENTMVPTELILI